MRRVIISTVGTSLITNQINRANSEEKDWYSHLRDTANLDEKDTPDPIKQIIFTLKERADRQLSNAKLAEIRRASAELNGIYGIYQNDLAQGKEDIHYLIATDTLQGKTTAQVVENFLREQGIINISIYAPSDLSTASTEGFSWGIDKLIAWLQETIPLHKEQQYKICFNLVGSFKSLQGYLNAIGMFYADEIVYIFEGQNAELITIPRLPITVDTNLLKPYVKQLALLETEATLTKEEVAGIPEAMVNKMYGQVDLSSWGKLIWNQCQEELLSGDLIAFERLEYQDSFRNEYNKVKNPQERLKLQQTLAKVAHLLEQSQGNTSPLKQDGGLQYDQYTNVPGKIDHFRVTQGIRVSCISVGGKLLLRHYGGEEYVNKNP